MRPPLLITGCPRSGTSLTAKVFSSLGCWPGNVSSQTENTEIRERVLKPMLEEAGMDKLALRSFADADGDPEHLRREVEEITRAQGLDPDEPWLYKDCKLVFCWETWAEAFPDATWVTVWRSPGKIIASMTRWGLADRVDFTPGTVIREHHDRAREIPDAVPVFPRHFIEGDESEYRVAALEYGIPWVGDIARRQIHPDRFR